MKPKLMLAMTLPLMLLLQGCPSVAGRTAPLPVSRVDHTADILADPQFPAMAQAAPDLTKRVLRTITRLDTEAANHGH